MIFDWQIIVVAVAVIWAAVVVVRHLFGMIYRPSTGGCGPGGCGACPSNAAAGTSGLVQLQPPTETAIMGRDR